MNGQDFLRIMTSAFAPFLRELGFAMDPPSISGRYYRASFTSPLHTVSVSYEPGDDALFVLIFGRRGSDHSDIDDRAKTPRLSDLNESYMREVTREEREANEAVFESINARDAEERRLVKAAKDLRLVLPRYLRSQTTDAVRSHP